MSLYWRRGSITVSCALVASAALATTAAAVVAPNVSFQLYAGGPGEAVMIDVGEGTQTDDGTWVFEGAGDETPFYALDAWSIEAGVGGNGRDVWSSVTANMSVRNFEDSYQDFWALVTVSLDDPLGPETLSRGTVSATVINTDFTGGDANIRNNSSGLPVYTGLIDGAPARTMWDSGFDLWATGPFGSNADDTSFGDPTPESNVAAASSISVWLRIAVSPEDQANVIGTFEVMAIPGPAGLTVLALGVFGFNRRRRS
jgi:hypothetical protein